MEPTIYRYGFPKSTAAEMIAEVAHLASGATASLVGEAAFDLDADFAFDAGARVCIVDAGTEVGRTFNRLFAFFASKLFDRGAVAVERVQ